MLTSELRGPAIVAHSGGPTSVINSSLAGVIEAARREASITALHGARFGIAGIIAGNFVDLFAQPASLVARIAESPSSALGSSRQEVSGADLEQALDVLAARAVRFLFYNGGNGSMGTADALAQLATDRGYELAVIGIPKTIDNDIVLTDHTPGYGSAARFAAYAVRDVGADLAALPGQVDIVEILGRNAGWLVAATALARKHPDDAPHLIYFPENRLSLDRFLNDVERVYRRLGRCLVAICEGQLDESGGAFGADMRTGSRGSLAMNVGHRLAMLVMEHLKIRARSEKPGLLGRSNSLYRSQRDWEEARFCGEAAVKAAARGASRQMIALERAAEPGYAVATKLVPLSDVAFLERPFPPEWRDEPEIGVKPDFFDYALPLAGEIGVIEKLEFLPPGGRNEAAHNSGAHFGKTMSSPR